MLFIVVQQEFPDIGLVQGSKVTSAEVVRGTTFHCKFSVQDLAQFAGLIRQIFLELTVDCVHFSLSGCLRKQGLFEELWKHVQRGAKVVVVDAEIVVCEIFSSCGILGAFMGLYELIVSVFLGILLTPEE